jgi:hypothetical protein
MKITVFWDVTLCGQADVYWTLLYVYVKSCGQADVYWTLLYIYVMCGQADVYWTLLCIYVKLCGQVDVYWTLLYIYVKLCGQADVYWTLLYIYVTLCGQADVYWTLLYIYVKLCGQADVYSIFEPLSPLPAYCCALKLSAAHFLKMSANITVISRIVLYSLTCIKWDLAYILWVINNQSDLNSQLVWSDSRLISELIVNTLQKVDCHLLIEYDKNN